MFFYHILQLFGHGVAIFYNALNFVGIISEVGSANKFIDQLTA